MKAFITPPKFRARITKTTPRKEPHGPDLVQAISLRMKWETTNDSLTLLHPRLKDMLFYREPQVDAQEELDGLPEVTPNLRVPIAGLPLGIEASFTGYTLHIEHGIDETTALELYVCTLDKFKVDAKEGGTVSIDWSLASNKDVTHELVGELCGLEGCEVVCTLTPPAIAAGEVIDGTTEAFERDHPGADDGQADLLEGDGDPTDTFLSQHGENQGDEEQAAPRGRRGHRGRKVAI